MIRIVKSLARRVLGKELSLLNSALLQAEQEACTYRLKLSNRDATITNLQEQLASLSKAPLIEYKITREVFRKQILEQLDQPMMNNTVTPQHTGFLLGIQRTLRVVERMVV